MHLNYHFLKFLCPELKKAFLGKSIYECFSQNKDELVIGCSDGTDQRYIRANLLPVISTLAFPEDFKRSKKNTISLFPEIIGKTVTNIQVYENERAFWMDLDQNIRLVFKLHGTRSNVLIYEHENPLPSLLFRNELRDDKSLDQKSLNVSLDLGFDRFANVEGNASKFIPTLGKIPRNWLKEKGYIEADLKRKWSLIQELIDLLDTPLFSIVKEDQDYFLSTLPAANPIFQTSDPIEACNELFRYKVVIQAFEKEKKHWIKYFEDQKKKAQSYLEKTESKLKSLQTEASPAQAADVIMANLHQIKPGTEKIELFNFYTQKEEVFRLKKNLSPQRFAESLYRKSKNRQVEIQHLEENLQAKQNQLDLAENKIRDLESISHFRQLKSFVKDNNLTQQQKEKEEQVPFKRFEVEGFEILVGKSAKSNDEMLRRYAWKEDLWLHAKDVSGSHVLIKYKSGVNFPKSVIENAAELAAFYSKNKNESLAAVIYTPVKYVRKVKGSAPGAVMVDKEKVVMAVPKSPREVL
ncbi:DUF814 domain-containing protein [Arthrospiribacter ruber]|uniref:DUF814 domain-containing protein n=1 Tax=Arthrospiribacter ruber TaxID=2487934 RepID=A0A951IYS2_9BACT|nr:NFACT RNA binding domain-containing protein [Arthrospiribacter ruber]MBW3469665.1 DUF814 domain-containing protein [Arthrospiribacter ruber]